MSGMVVQADRIGGPGGVLDEAQVREFVVRSLAGAGLDGRSVCVIVPDATRTRVLAHSTHLRGAGTYDPAHGEHGRVTVTLATGIPEHVVRAANLDHLDPALIDLDRLAADPDTLVVADAGEVLYRLR
jgi:hypothetical protein